MKHIMLKQLSILLIKTFMITIKCLYDNGYKFLCIHDIEEVGCLFLFSYWHFKF